MMPTAGLVQRSVDVISNQMLGNRCTLERFQPHGGRSLYSIGKHSQRMIPSELTPRRRIPGNVKKRQRGLADDVADSAMYLASRVGNSYLRQSGEVLKAAECD